MEHYILGVCSVGWILFLWAWYRYSAATSEIREKNTAILDLLSWKWHFGTKYDMSRREFDRLFGRKVCVPDMPSPIPPPPEKRAVAGHQPTSPDSGSSSTPPPAPPKPDPDRIFDRRSPACGCPRGCRDCMSMLPGEACRACREYFLSQGDIPIASIRESLRRLESEWQREKQALADLKASMKPKPTLADYHTSIAVNEKDLPEMFAAAYRARERKVETTIFNQLTPDPIAQGMAEEAKEAKEINEFALLFCKAALDNSLVRQTIRSVIQEGIATNGHLRKVFLSAKKPAAKKPAGSK